MTSETALPEPLARYFEAMGANDFETAIEQFTEDCVYYHTPSFRDDPAIRGREDFRAYLVEERGERAIEHDIQKVVTDGERCGIVGHLSGEDIDGEDYFVSFAELEGDRIAYYIAGLLLGSA